MSNHTPPTTNDIALQRSIGFSAARLISETSPLRGKEAADSMRLHFSKLSNQAGKDGLTEGDVMQMLRDQ